MKRRFKSDIIKAYLLPALLITVVFLVLSVVTFFALEHHYRCAINDEVAGLAGAIKDAYPELDDAFIIETMEAQRDSKAGQALLEKYGYDDSAIYSRRVEKFAISLFVTLTGIAALLAAALIWFFLHGRRGQERQLEELISYVRDINDHIYDLKVEENTESALSRLKNELYKITVLLKETSENSRRESENLARSIADISHQLKTPLTSMRIILDNLEDDPEMDSATRAAFIRTLSIQTERISTLVVSLLHLAQFDSGTIQMHPKAFCIGDLLHDVLERLAIMTEVRNVTAEYTGDLDANIILDYKWQSEAILNVVKNCVEHSPDGGRLYLNVENTALFLKLTIRDEGEGVSRRDRAHIFERFYKGKNSAPDSIGIGLAFAKTVIEKENGFITVDSEPGNGTSFTIRYKK